MIHCAFVAAAGLMQQVKNRVHDEHPNVESCCTSGNDACFSPFRGKLHRPGPQAIELVP
jgi:hypothetical protein